jgi:hypothetical protein
MAAACSAVPVDPYAVPREELSEKQREKVDYILADVAAVVPLDAADVRSRPEVYDFLMNEMPFTGGAVREMGRGNWDIFRDADQPDPGVFYVVEPDGMKLRFELVHRDATRRFYVSRGSFPMGVLPTLTGRTLVVMRTLPDGDVIHTDAVVYVRVESSFYANLAKMAKDTLVKIVREKSGYFIRAAKWVSEETARRPAWLYEHLRGSKEVDQVVLEEFRKRFLAK